MLPSAITPELPATGAAEPDAAATVCERCGGGFHCGVADAAPCACTQLRLTGEHRSALREQFQHCLCVRCLAAISAGAPVRLDER